MYHKMLIVHSSTVDKSEIVSIKFLVYLYMPVMVKITCFVVPKSCIKVYQSGERSQLQEGKLLSLFSMLCSMQVCACVCVCVVRQHCQFIRASACSRDCRFQRKFRGVQEYHFRLRLQHLTLLRIFQFLSPV